MLTHKVNIPFFSWFQLSDHQIIVTDKITNTYILSNDKSIESIHPPEEALSFKGVKASPFKEKYKTDNILKESQLNHIIDQNNYTNLYLQSIGKQTTRIENIISNTSVPILKYKIPSGAAMFKPPPQLDASTTIKKSENELLNALVSKLKNK